MGKSVLQDWVMELPFMQQTVLLTAIRGPDNTPKYGPVKMLMRWYRRCVLLSAMDGRALTDPYETNGGSFTGPSLEVAPKDRLKGSNIEWEGAMDLLVDRYLQTVDALPHHFHLHFMRAAAIIGYKHPDRRIRDWWFTVYVRFCRDMHVNCERLGDMDRRLGDSRAQWLQYADPATAD